MARPGEQEPFEGQLGAGLGAHGGRSAYLGYVVPGILLIAVSSAVKGTAIMVAMDMTGGIIDRYRTMAIARASVLTRHVLGSLIQVLAGLATIIGVALAGYLWATRICNRRRAAEPK